METDDPRRSDRVYLELEVVISGADAMGQEFVEKTRTLVLTRHGAKIVSTRTLVPDQVILLQCHKTARESDARVVGQIRQDAEGNYYGVELLDLGVNLWDIEFPPMAESDLAVGRVLLECPRCHRQEVTCLDVFGMEVLLAEGRLSRRCQRCNDATLWGRAVPRPVEEEAHDTAPRADQRVQPSRTDRRYARVNLQVDVCILHPEHGEEVTVTENVSRGGFRFKSKKGYRQGSVIKYALPYSPAGGNIFAEAQIVYVERLAREGTTAYGVSYISNRKVKS
jgi:hypothetical protein